MDRIVYIFLSGLIFLSFFDFKYLGVTSDCGVVNHFVYMFFHANVFHALTNGIALYFSYKAIPKSSCIKATLISYAVAVITSFLCITSSPTVGISAFIWGLFGYIFTHRLFNDTLNRKLIINICIALSLGFLFSNVNSWIHITAFSLSVKLSILSGLYDKRNNTN